MKVKYIGDYYKISLIKDKIYEVLSIESGWYRIIDETEDDYLFLPTDFEVIESSPEPPIIP